MLPTLNYNEDQTLFRGGWVFDGVHPPVEGRGVLVQEGRIRAVSSPGEFAGFSGNTIDTTGCTLMPGLIDCHVHLSLSAEQDVVGTLVRMCASEVCLQILENAQSALLGGITSVRDLGGRDWLEMGIRDAFASGRHLGPLIRCAGKVVCMTGGHGHWTGIEADGVDAVMKAVRTNIRAGADCIKLMATGGVLTPGVDPLAAHLTLEELQAAVQTAHGLGRKVASHAQGAEGIRNATLAGVDSIEHGFELTDEVVQLMIDRGVCLVPTLTATRKLVQNAERLPAYVRAKALRFGDMHQQSFRRYAAAGGKIAMGTDAGTPFNRHGANAQELAQMVELGLSELEALRAGTRHAAELLELNDVGIIREGFRADLLLVNGNPASDIARASDVSNHRLVLKDGKDVHAWLPRSAHRHSTQQPANLGTVSGLCCLQ